MAVSMNLTLTLNGVTYGELYEFVDAARAAGVPEDEKVRCLGSDELGDRFELDIDPTQRKKGSSGAAAAAITGAPAPVENNRDNAGPSIPVGKIAETMRDMAGNEEEMERLINMLKDMRKFWR